MLGRATVLAVTLAALVACEKSSRTRREAPRVTRSDSYETVTCVVEGGTLACSGHNGWANLGLGYKSEPIETPTPVPGIDDAVDVAVGIAHTCALHASGKVSCWGSRLQGQVGDGVPDTPNPDIAANDQSLLQLRPKTVPSLDGIVQVVATNYGTCARAEDGDVYCWGQVGRPGSSPPAVTRVNELAPSERLFGGARHVCSLSTRDDVACWGWTTDEKGDPVILGQPTVVLHAKSASDVRADAHGLCVSAESGLRCWGNARDLR